MSGSASGAGTPRIVVVGTCASGKSTLVQALRQLGVEAVISAQEHSEIRSLWARANPDVLVVLEADLDTVRARRGETWPAAVYAAQRARLTEARAAADLVIDTSATSVERAVALVLRLLESRAA